MARASYATVDRIEDLPMALTRLSGVYVIKSKQTKKVFYVGESHTNQLRKTLFRHFQNWEPDHSHPKRAVYDRNRVTVIVYITPASQAIDFQNELICELQPRDALLICAPLESDSDSGDPF